MRHGYMRLMPGQAIVSLRTDRLDYPTIVVGTNNLTPACSASRHVANAASGHQGIDGPRRPREHDSADRLKRKAASWTPHPIFFVIEIVRCTDEATLSRCGRGVGRRANLSLDDDPLEVPRQRL